MTEPKDAPAPATPDDKPVDPKEAMRAALEAKKKANHAHNDGPGGSKSMGSASSKVAGKRQFRRKSGG